MKKKKTKRPTPHLSTNVEVEDRNVVAVTVAWMLATTASFAAQLIGLAAWLMLSQVAPEAGKTTLGLLPGFMWFIAVVTGVIGLLLMPIVYRKRKVLPPLSIAAGALLIDSMPLILPIVWLVTQRRG